MTAPLMPKATALWLIRNTKLTFEQIADFCELHPLEIRNLADDSVSLAPFDPVASRQLSLAEIKRCEENPKESLKIIKTPSVGKPEKQTKYVPLVHRGDRPNAIIWLVKNHPTLSDRAICKLIRTSPDMVKSIRSKTYWNIKNLVPQNPVKLSLCSQDDLEKALEACKKAEALEG